MYEETLLYSDYVIAKSRPSNIDLKATIIEEVGLMCPRCKKYLATMEQGGEQKCGSCHLHMQRWGNALVCRV